MNRGIAFVLYTLLDVHLYQFSHLIEKINFFYICEKKPESNKFFMIVKM